MAGIPLNVYATSGGLDLVAKQIVAENPSLQLEIRRIGWMSSKRTLREDYESGRFRTASVVFADRDRIMASEIVKGGIRLGGKELRPSPLWKTSAQPNAKRVADGVTLAPTAQSSLARDVGYVPVTMQQRSISATSLNAERLGARRAST